MKLSIKLKSSIFLAVLLLLTVSVLSALVLKGIENNQIKEYEYYLKQQGQIATFDVKQNYYVCKNIKINEFLKKKGDILAKEISIMNGMQVIIYDINGKKVGSSNSKVSNVNVQDTLEIALQNKIAYEVMGNYVYYMFPLYITNGQAGVIHFKYSLNKMESFYISMKKLCFLIGTAIFIISFITAYLYFEGISEGILKLKRITEKIRNREFDNNTILDRNDELGELSKYIYFMGTEIERYIETMKIEQENLKLSINKSKILEKQQKQFIDNITHEFKTPLTAIKAYVDLMEMYPEKLEIMEKAKLNIGKEVERLHEMVEKILNLATLEKYNFEFNREKICVKLILMDICERMKGKIYKFGLNLKIEVSSGNIYIDKESFIQILINLLDNAIKYNNPNGKIIVRNYIDNKCMYIEVEDTGIGIPMNQKDKIFEPFYIVDKARSRECGGSGIGLSIVKLMVEKQNGTIRVVDAREKGSIFQITFPL